MGSEASGWPLRPRTTKMTSASATHVLTRSASRALYAEGDNKFGQICTGTADSKKGDVHTHNRVLVARDVTAFAAGGSSASGHTIFTTGRFGVNSCGCDRWQQLGIGGKVGGAAGYTWEAGATAQRAPRRVAALEGKEVVDLAAGDDHSAAMLASGEVWTWGRGHVGQLGRPKQFVSTPAVSPQLSGARAIAASGDCTCAWLERRGGAQCVGRCAAVEAALKDALQSKLMQNQQQQQQQQRQRQQ